MVDSCRVCESCKAVLENYCENGAVFTYNSEDKNLGGMTYGGYSKSVVVNEDFVLWIPKEWSPLRMPVCAFPCPVRMRRIRGSKADRVSF